MDKFPLIRYAYERNGGYTLFKHIQKIGVLSIVFIMTLTYTLNPVEAKTSFGKEIDEAIEREIIKGFANGDYRLNETVKRKDFAALLDRLLKLEDDPSLTFLDVQSTQTQAKSIRAVVKAGYMNGKSNGEFMPDNELTREQLAVVLANVLKNYKFNDVADYTIRDTASFLIGGQQSVLTAVNYGVVNGYSVDHANKTLEYRPIQKTKRSEAAVTLLRLEKVILAGNKPGEPEKPTQPETPSNVFQLGVLKGSVVTGTGEVFNHYQEALHKMNQSKESVAVLKGNKVVAVKNGFAYRNVHNSTVSIYLGKNRTNYLTYVSSGVEMRVIENGESDLLVDVGGIKGYVRAEDVILKTYQEVEARDHYTVATTGEIVHRAKNHFQNNLTGSYIIGPKSQTMQTNRIYYSTDAIHYKDAITGGVVEHYPYFQFLSIRSKTSYTAQELDFIINTRLKEIDKKDTRFEGAIEKSKLLGLGEVLKDIESKRRVNAMFILNLAFHESAYGMSTHAQESNNLFGLRVLDSKPTESPKFNDVRSNIEELINGFIDLNYTKPISRFAYGAVPGNKSLGLNVYYASDPDWGGKIASHMYRSDKILGSKDLNRYKRGIISITNGMSVNVRQGEGVNTPVLYTYSPKNGNFAVRYPVAIVEEKKLSDGYVWYKIFSDDPKQEFGWVRSDLVRIIPNE